MGQIILKGLQITDFSGVLSCSEHYSDLEKLQKKIFLSCRKRIKFQFCNAFDL